MSQDIGTRLYTLEELIRDPALLVPPPLVLPRMAWEGRLTILAAPDKAGKSTLTGQGVAAIATQQHFLDGVPPEGHVLWLALDEPLGDTVRRLRGYGAVDGVSLCCERPGSVELQDMIEKTGARLLVVDTLTEFAGGLVTDQNDAQQWQPIFRELRTILQATSCAGLLLHHVTKGTGRYRGSGQIGAGVDVIIEMAESESDPTVRKCRTRGRVEVQNFDLRFTKPWYNLEASGEASLELRIYRAVESRPGVSKRQLREMVPGKVTAITAEIERMVAAGLLTDRGDKSRSAYYAGTTGNHPGTAEEPLERTTLSVMEPTGNHLGTTNGNHGGSHPLKGVGGNHLSVEPLERGDAWEPEPVEAA